MATFLRSAFLIGFAGILAAQEPAKPASDAPSEKTIMRMAKDIQRGILTSSNYGVFDWITFGINGYNVILKGKASRPTLKDSAERIAKQVDSDGSGPAAAWKEYYLWDDDQIILSFRDANVADQTQPALNHRFLDPGRWGTSS